MLSLALLYHDVVPRGYYAASGFSIPGAHHYKLTREQFDSHLQAIAKVAPRPPARVIDDNWETSFLFTVDDGGSSALHVADRLEERGWKAHFLVATNYIGSVGFLTERQIRDLAARQHVIGSHSCSHPLAMWDCTPDELFSEWSDSRRRLEDILGIRVAVASVPAGSYTAKVGIAAAKAGLTVLFTSEPTRQVDQINGCRIVGRYGITHTTAAEVAAKLANGKALTCWKQKVFWNARKLVKRAAARPYAAVRARLLEAG